MSNIQILLRYILFQERSLKRSISTRERSTIDPALNGACCWTVLYSSRVPSPPTVRRLRSQWRSRPRATLHFYRSIKRRAVDPRSFFLHLLSRSFGCFARPAYENAFDPRGRLFIGIFLDRDVNRRFGNRARPIMQIVRRNFDVFNFQLQRIRSKMNIR